MHQIMDREPRLLLNIKGMVRQLLLRQMVLQGRVIRQMAGIQTVLELVHNMRLVRHIRIIQHQGRYMQIGRQKLAHLM